MSATKSELIKGALEKMRLDGIEYWRAVDLFDKGASVVSVPVYEDREYQFDIRIEIDMSKAVKDAQQLSLF